MSEKLSAEQLNTMPKEALVAIVLSMQDQLEQLNSKMDNLMEQIALANNYRFGRHTEKLSQYDGQGYIGEDGQIYFNDAEAIHDLCPEPEEPTIETIIRKRTPRPKGKKEQDLSGFPVYQLPTVDVPEEDLIREFGSLDNCRRMPDEVFKRLRYIPAGWQVEETHVAVYRNKTGEAKFLKGETPAYLLRGSIVTPSLEAAIITAKFANAQPFRRIEKDYEQNGVSISEQNMAYWTIACADRYFSRLYNYLHSILTTHRVLHADETTVEVTNDGHKTGSNSYMWVYRTGKYEKDHPIVLYDYQKTRGHEHPEQYLENFQGYLVCDGFSGYKALSNKNGSIKLAGCWAHARRKFSDAVKASQETKTPERSQLATDALQMIAAISHAEENFRRCLRKNVSESGRSRSARLLTPSLRGLIKWQPTQKSL